MSLRNVFKIEIGQHIARGSASDLNFGGRCGQSDNLEKKGNPDKGVVAVLQRFLFTFLSERKARQEREK